MFQRRHKHASVRSTGLFCAAALLAGPAFGGGVNLPLDTDGDDLSDFAEVDDWDGDGTLEIADIAQAIAALTDPGDKLVHVLPGDFAPPTSPGDNILALPSDLTLRGSGAGLTVLHGYPGTDLTSTGAVIVNAQQYTGNEGITIADLEIDGGWRGGNGSFPHARAGILLSQCHSCLVEHVTIRDTLHTCLYTKDGQDVDFRENTLLRCGNYTGQGNCYPCIYLYAGPGRTQQDVHVVDNICLGTGHSGLNTRTDNGVLQNLVFSGNWIENTRISDGRAEGCIYISGVSGASYLDNVCVNTGPLRVLDSSDILVDGLALDTLIGTDGVELDGSRNVTLQHLSIAHGPYNGIDLLPATDGSSPDHENLTIRDCSVVDVGDFGIGTFVPLALELHNVTIEGNVLDGIGQAGIVLAATTPSSGVIVRDNTVRDFGRAGSSLARGIWVSGDMSALEVRDNVLDDVDDQAKYGIFHDVSPAGDLSPLCDNEFSGTLDPDEHYYVASDVATWSTDADLDSSVAACDCNDADASVYPEAPEENDAQDNECPGDPGYGVVDEISGAAGFYNPDVQDEFSWTAQSGATRYDVLRAAQPIFSGPCASWTTPDTAVVDSFVPPPSWVVYYLVRAHLPNTGSWGQTSDGTERVDLCGVDSWGQARARPRLRDRSLLPER